FGAAGKMGRAILRATIEEPRARVAAAIDRAGSGELGHDAGTLIGLPATGVTVSAGAPGAGVADVWIDFSSPATAVANAEAAAAAGAGYVLGTTGLAANDKAAIAATAKRSPIVFSPNMSVGVNVLLKLVADAARALGPAYDIEVLEAHHRMKRDAPSGTALRLAEAAAEGSGRDLEKTARYDRHGDIGPRTQEEIGMQTLRGGDVVGDHTVFFFGPGDRVEITHRASSRETFAKGAVRAAVWLFGKPAGLYDMRDVLGLR
ncbi:MAG TPA: 4-hydroxy-tetrahydrodipicolinate reductase, partial [Polyangia bacterium]